MGKAWEMMNRTFEAFATRITESSEKEGGKSRKTFKKTKEFKDDSDGCIETWVEVMRLHLEYQFRCICSTAVSVVPIPKSQIAAVLG